MWTSEKTDDGKPTVTAWDGDIGKIQCSHRRAHRGQQGTSTAFALVPERRAGAVVLANMDSVNSNHVAEEILRIVLDLQETASKN